VTTSRGQIEVQGIPIEVVRKNIKNLHVGVYPPYGRVRVAAPTHVSDEAIRLAVVSRLAWIRRQQRSFSEQRRESEREMTSGESHYFQGRRYRLEVVEADGPASVGLKGKSKLQLKVRPGTDREAREAMLQRWYRARLREQVPGLIAKWEPVVGVSVAECRIKRMKTHWGTCSVEARRIWLNLELIKKPVECLEYILVHEMVHLLERQHTDRFKALMDRFMPKWRQYRDELNAGPLGHEHWEY
jgi:predicted metal-dependent hydrolase